MSFGRHAVRRRVPFCRLSSQAAAVTGSSAAWRPKVATPISCSCLVPKGGLCKSIRRTCLICWLCLDVLPCCGMLCRALGAGQDLKEFDVDNTYGQTALTRILDDCTGKTLHMEAVQVMIWA